MTRRIQVLFVAALLGVLVALGVLAAALGGPWAAAAYAVVVGALLLVAAARARRRAQEVSGRTCSCCTSTQFDEVKIV